MLNRSRATTARGLLAAVLAVLPWASAQWGVPYVPPEVHQDVRRLQGDTLTFCIWPTISATAALDREVAEAIGMVLLVDVVIHEFVFDGVLSPDEFLEEVYIQLGARCDALPGFVLAAESFPEWLMPSRPYLAAPYVAILPEGGSGGLGALPPAAIIGSQVYTEGDLQVQHYLRSMPASQRWRRFPYGSIELLARHVRSGTLAAGIVWQPSWAAAVAADPAVAEGLIANTSVSPLPTTLSRVGFAMRSDNTFLRTILDTAIVALEQEGLLAEFAALHGYEHVDR